MTYSITDGGSLDESGISNGVIVDPVALASVVVAAPNTGFGTPASMGPFAIGAACVTSTALLIAGLYSYYRYRYPKQRQRSFARLK